MMYIDTVKGTCCEFEPLQKEHNDLLDVDIGLPDCGCVMLRQGDDDVVLAPGMAAKLVKALNRAMGL